MSDPFIPRTEHRFTFGLWTVGNPGRDPFGHEVRAPLDPVESVHRLAELGAYGVSFHDDDLVPYGVVARRARGDREAVPPGARRDRHEGADGDDQPVLRGRSSRRAPSRPTTRRAPLRGGARPCDAIDLGRRARRGGLRDVGRPRGRRGRRGQGRAAARSTATRRRSTCAASTSANAGYGLRIALEPKPNEPRGDIFLPTVGHALAFIGELEWPDMVGLNPEFAHETMCGLNFTHAVAQALWHDKLFHIDLNAQRIGKFDQDFRFGSEGIRDAFYLVQLLEDSGWDGMRHFDAHPYRTEDADGVWDFAARLHAHLPDPQATRPSASARTPRSRTRCARPRPTSWPSRPVPLGAGRAIRRRRRRGRAGRAGLRPRAPRPARDGAAARRALMPLVAGVDSSTSACKVQVRDVDTGAARGRRPRAAPADHAAAQRAAPAGLVDGLRAGLRAGRRARPQPPGGASPSPASSTGSSSLDADGERAAPGQALERHRVGARRRRAGRRLLGGAEAWADGLRERAGRQLHHHQAALAATLRARRASVALAARPAPARLADVPADRAPDDRSGRRVGDGLLVAGRGALPLRPARPGRRRPWTGTTLLPEVLAPDRAVPGSGQGDASSVPAPATTWPPRSDSGCGRATSR